MRIQVQTISYTKWWSGDSKFNLFLRILHACCAKINCAGKLMGLRDKLR